MELVLNLKQLRIAYEGEAEETLTLKAIGPKEVTAKDIKGPATVTIVNKDQPIASLADKNAKLDVEMKVNRGMGYSPAEDRKTNTIGVIPLDATYSPVNRVAYTVEATRVGRRTDLDKLVIKVWTDGSIKPKKALESASEILVDFFRQVYKPVVQEKKEEPTELDEALNGEVYDLTVEELELPTRIANALRRGGYKTVRHIVEASSADLAKVKNLGEKSIGKVAKALEKKGVVMKGA